MNVELSEEVLKERAAVTGQFPLHGVLLASTAVAVVMSFYTYFFTKNYDFLVEAPCHTSFQQCYVRDCSAGECPPNNLSSYSLYRVPAGLFGSCTDNGCLNICTQGNTACKNIPCLSQTDIECSEPASAR